MKLWGASDPPECYKKSCALTRECQLTFAHKFTNLPKFVVICIYLFIIYNIYILFLLHVESANFNLGESARERRHMRAYYCTLPYPPLLEVFFCKFEEFCKICHFLASMESVVIAKKFAARLMMRRKSTVLEDTLHENDDIAASLITEICEKPHKR